MTRTPQAPIGSGFGRHTPASEVVADMDLSGKSAIVTGGYSGIGLETVRALASRGARVLVPARNRAKAEEALEGVAGDVTIGAMDLADLPSVRSFAHAATEWTDRLHILINNAGIMACPETRIGPGWEAQLATNHYGHFVLTEGLMPLLDAADGARVVALSSTAHIRGGILWDDPHFRSTPYQKWDAYAQSKSANSLFAVELDRIGQERGIRAFAVHPGGIFTPLQRHLTVDEMAAMGWMNPDGTIPDPIKALFKNPEAGASTSVWAATSPQLDGMGGVYCEDCDVAKLADENSQRWEHVRPHAIDPAGATRLWEMTVRDIAAA